MAKKDKKNTNKVDEMFKYTYRDIGQEYIMQKKMIRAIIALVISLIALAVFVALYILTNREGCRKPIECNI